MSVYNVQRKPGFSGVICKNGTPAAWSEVDNRAAGAYNKKVNIASHIWTTANCPTVRAQAAWSATGDVTTNVRACTAKLRADIPVILEFANIYEGSTLLTADAYATIYNGTESSCTITDMYAYQGDPTDNTTKWYLSATGDYIIPAYSTVDIYMVGRIHPGYLHDVKISSGDMNLIFIDTKAIKSGSAPKLLAFSMRFLAHQNWDVDNGLDLQRPTPNSDITAVDWYSNYITGLERANTYLHCQNTGTMAPVDQYTGNGVYGFELNAYYTTRYYHFFMPNTTYNSTTETAGSMWCPLAGLGVYNSNSAKYKYKITCSWMQRSSVTCTLTYSFYYFLKDSTSGVSLGSVATQAVTANTNYVVSRIFYIESSTMIEDGVAVLPRLIRTGSTGNCYIYTSQFSAQITPYPY